MSARRSAPRPAGTDAGGNYDPNAPRNATRMDLYTRSDDPAGHAIRLVLAEKGIGARLVEVDAEAPPEDILNLNPYGSLPSLVSREIALYAMPVIVEYLDERYPHPPLMPFDPVLRAQMRLFIREVSGGWYGLCSEADNGSPRGKARARRELAEAVVANEEIFDSGPFLLNDHYGLADCVVAPVLWRLPYFGVRLPPDARALKIYMKRCFHRPGFAGSLTKRERAMGVK